MKVKHILLPLAFIILALLFAYGNLIAINFRGIRNEENIYLATIFLIISTLFLGFKKIEFNKTNFLILSFFILFWIVVFISIYINDELKIIMVLTYLVLPLIILLNANVSKHLNIVLLAVVVSGIPLLVNIQESNSFGLIITICFVALYSIDFSDKIRYYMIIFSPLTVYFVYITESRTTLLSYSIFITIYYLKHFLFKKQSIKNWMFSTGLMLIILLMGMSFINNFVNLIFYKRANTTSNFLADRQIFWLGTVRDGVTWLGNGKNYFINSFGIGDSHNIFIEILGLYGFIAIAFFVIVIILLLKKLFFIKNEKKYLPLFFFIYFFATGFAENLSFLDNRLITYHVLFLVFVSYVLNLKLKSEDELV